MTSDSNERVSGTMQRGAGKWTIAEVERLGAFMADKGITVIELAGLKLVRHPQQELYGSLGKKAQELEDATEGVTDEDILNDPLAGLPKGVTGHG